MFNKFFSFFLFSFFLIFVSSADSAPKDKPPKKWPCDQVYNPQLNLTAIWQGPSIESALKDWWKHDDVIEYVNTLSSLLSIVKTIEDALKSDGLTPRILIGVPT